MKTRITITAYDDKSFNQLINRPLIELIDATKETGLCLLVYNTGVQAYVEKTKAGYTVRAWKDERDG